MDQNATWYESRPQPEPELRPRCVRWGFSSTSPTERGTVAPPTFRPISMWPNGRLSQRLLSSCLTTYCSNEVHFCLWRWNTKLWRYYCYSRYMQHCCINGQFDRQRHRTLRSAIYYNGKISRTLEWWTMGWAASRWKLLECGGQTNRRGPWHNVVNNVTYE